MLSICHTMVMSLLDTFNDSKPKFDNKFCFIQNQLKLNKWVHKSKRKRKGYWEGLWSTFWISDSCIIGGTNSWA